MANVQVGKVPKNVKTRILSGGTEWNETPFFAPGLDKDSEHMTAMPVGTVIAGKLMALKTTKAESESDQRDYACLVDLESEAKFRIQAPGQLYYLLEQAGIGTAVTIKYMGKVDVKGFKQKLHQFEVAIIEGSLN